MMILRKSEAGVVASATLRLAIFLLLVSAGCAQLDSTGNWGREARSGADRHTPAGSHSADYTPAEASAPVQGDSLQPSSPIQPATYVDAAQQRDSTSPSVAAPQTPLPSPRPVLEDRYAVDLATVLRLAGASNLQIALAAERVCEAQARLEGAEVLWIPSITAGVGYNKHDGRLQETQGDVLEVSRNSLFVGGGAALSAASLAGGAGGPSRLVVDLSLADVLFEPLAARQSVRAARADRDAVFNDVLLEVALAYYRLVRAQMRVAIAHEAVTNARELARLTREFAQTGAGLEADAQRAQADLSEREGELLAAEEAVQVASAELARLLRLDPAVTLFPLQTQPVPTDLIDTDVPLDGLIAQAVASRPELARNQAILDETLERQRQEQWRPWIPSLFVGFGSGGFGGGPSSFFGDFSDRTDFDALAVWELRNLGLGNRALQRERISQHLQAHLAAEQVRDLVAAEVARAYHQVQLRRQQIDAARARVEAAAAALPLNFRGILGDVLRPVEAQQAIGALAAARGQYVAAVIGYNEAQLALLRAVGRSPEAPIAEVAAGASN